MTSVETKEQKRGGAGLRDRKIGADSPYWIDSRVRIYKKVSNLVLLTVQRAGRGEYYSMCLIRWLPRIPASARKVRVARKCSFSAIGWQVAEVAGAYSEKESTIPLFT